MKVEKFKAVMKDVGGIPVARLLPKGKRRTIGAWCFLDHIGPVQFAADSRGMQVGSHPHTNLSTFTWMLAGEQIHRDSLGSHLRIGPKQVGLMTAGSGNARGICHTEQTPDDVNNMHAVQLWIALPPDSEIEAAFEYHSDLPQWNEQGAAFTLTTGSFAGRRAPTTQHSPLLGVDIRFSETAAYEVEMQPGWEYGVLIIGGSVAIGGETFGPQELAFIEGGGSFTLHAEAGTHLMLLGGEPLAQPIVMWWNFVAYRREDLVQAVADWNAGHPRFGSIDLAGTGLSRLPAPEMPDTPLR